MRKLALFFCMLVQSVTWAQSFSPSVDSYVGTTSPGTGTVKFAVTHGSGSYTVCMYSGTACGNNVTGTAIFYTLDGSDVTPASIWYSCSTSTTGCVTVSAPVGFTVVIQAMLVQIDNSSTGATGVIIQDAYNTRANLKLNLSCTSSQCGSTVFTNVPSTIQYGSNATPANGNNGCRGVPTLVTNQYGLSQPSVDPFSANTGTCDAVTMGTAGSTLSSGPATEILENYLPVTNLNGSNGCPTCTHFDEQMYIGHAYEGTTTTTNNPANMGDLETDFNFYDNTAGTSTQCTSSPPTVACYGAGNIRCQPADLTVTVGGVKYSGYYHSSQTSDWQPFTGTGYANVAPSHDCTYPFGTVNKSSGVGMDATTCNLVFTPGAVNYNSQMSWGIESNSYLILDSGLSTQETIYLKNVSGNAVIGANNVNCIRGIGGTAYAHGVNALASQMVLVQMGFTKDTTLASGGSPQATCETGTREPLAMYYNYLALNHNVYGTAAGNALVPDYTVLDTWPTQQVNGSAHSKICDYYGLAQIYDYSTGKFFGQVQPYTKLSSGVVARIKEYIQHANWTAHFGILGTVSKQTLSF